MEWELDFETVGDPHHEISGACCDAGFLKLVVNENTARFDEDPNSPYRHPKGYFQPGVLALTAEGRVLYRWRSRPTRKNMGGATHRPTASHVFEHVSRALDASTSPERGRDAELDPNPEVDSGGMPWSLLIALQIANGWFLKPVTFGQGFGGPSVAVRMKRSMLRLPLFLAAWIAAFAILPKVWVGIALVAWIAWLAPKIREISRQYQPDIAEN